VSVDKRGKSSSLTQKSGNVVSPILSLKIIKRKLVSFNANFANYANTVINFPVTKINYHTKSLNCYQIDEISILNFDHNGFANIF